MNRLVDTTMEVSGAPRVLVFVKYYLPGYKSGGPVRTIAAMVERLGDEFDFHVVTTDRDSGDDTPYDSVQIEAWNDVAGAKVYYVGDGRLGVRKIAKIVREVQPKLIYLNSFFRYRFSTLPLAARALGLLGDVPVVLAPRGEFSPGAVSIKSWKKVPFVRLSRFLRLHKGVLWHASTPDEARNIQRVIGASPQQVVVAANLAVPLADGSGGGNAPPDGEDGPLRVVFLSRISPMKNLDFALDVLARVGAAVELDVYGNISDVEYWADCERRIGRLPSHIHAEYCGVVPHEEVGRVLASYDLFFLPTRGENYGHAIVEALASGTPVLISDQTPWNNVSERGAGAALPLNDPDAYVREIESHAAASTADRAAVRSAAAAYGREILHDEETLLANRRVFARALEG